MFEDRNKAKRKVIKSVLISMAVSLGIGIPVFLFASNYIVRDIEQDPRVGGTERNAVPRQISYAQTPEPNDVAQGNAAQNNNTLENTEREYTIQEIVKSVMPGVVGISVLKVDGNSIFDRNTESWGVGSGVIVSTNGYILTNHHVAGGKNKRIIVSLEDGRNIDGTTVWSDPVLDLAIVKVNATGLQPIPLGDANALVVGEPAIAIGNPLGLQFQRTVTSGIISALNRTIEIETEGGINYMEDLIQTDASINPGNSGGPLINSKGQVVGINTVKVTSAEGIGFAVPINIAVPIINQFIENGEFVEPYLGVFAYDKEVVLYIDSTKKLDKGVYIAKIDENGPAFKSGLRVGCIIKEVDGKEVNTMMQLRTYIYSKKPGDIINITCQDETTRSIPLKLGVKERDGLVTR
ncbi:S1C family serine protease [Acetivibrio clariflavus]|uniref:Trypsin-like serine protease with C-terminal PDZ domain n=1 Tax=Acetivibrio clariflavus (strain DSM 19732 / NBRC 101661 / EBR45) TaxID=720554 RepID=G8LTR9_ACECE|nr:trypsin-like peptidase domain-containing protein [Acetivibrio clariflavus]AEV70579.1 trypsin-like serine protease with C-terminal PDZ domain [Acetivibrio clariflavus DSM 19732]HOQ00412.1 trypsin-like peptidase domain-containing protein [Acetivibrio clariflavus]HPU42560.1 trypsin-like peptidase domain-containing protein [Acetivibrio clariflavus]